MTGKKLQVYGVREVKFDVWDERRTTLELSINSYVADARRAIVATSRLLDRGYGVIES